MVEHSPLQESHVLALASPQAWVPPVAVVVQLNLTLEIPMHSALKVPSVPMVMLVLPSAVVVSPMDKAVAVLCIQVVVQEVALVRTC